MTEHAPLASPALRAYLDLMAAEVGMDLPPCISAEDAEELRLLLQDLTGRGLVRSAAGA
jgi:hypothetical protein